jgi:hypothetical protein
MDEENNIIRMDDAIVSHEQAIWLKRIGFTQEVHNCYRFDADRKIIVDRNKSPMNFNALFGNEIVSAPYLTHAIEWVLGYIEAKFLVNNEIQLKDSKEAASLKIEFDRINDAKRRYLQTFMNLTHRLERLNK